MFALVLAGSPCSFAIDDTAKIQQTEAQTIKVKKGATLSLNDCIAIALNNSPAIKNAQYDYNISKSQVSIARSEFFPTIGVGAGYDFDSIHAKRIKTNTNSYNLNASMNMLLFNFGKTNARISMQKFYMIADEYNFYNAVREITFNVKQKYYQVLAARAGVLINEAYVDINERNYQRTKAYYDEGLKSKIDLVNAEVTLSDSKIGLIKSQTTYEKSLVSLNNAMYLVDAPSYNISEEGVNLNDIVAPVDLTRFQKITSKEDDKTPQAVSDAKFTSAVEKLELLTDYKIEKFPYTFDECIDMKRYMKTSQIGMSTVMIDREKVKDVQFPNDRKLCEDARLWMKYLRRGEKFYGLNKILLLYRIRSNQLSRHKHKMAWQAFKRFMSETSISPVERISCYAVYAKNALKKYKSKSHVDMAYIKDQFNCKQ